MEIDVNPIASEWILKQPWLSQFVDNCIVQGNTTAMTLAYLLGAESPNTVDNAFLWLDTPEGEKFWSNINERMIINSIEEDWDNFDTTIEI